MRVYESTRSRRIAIPALAAVLLAASAGAGEPEAERVRPRYLRDEARPPVEAALPEPGAVPDDLRMGPPGASGEASLPSRELSVTEDELEGGAARTRPGPGRAPRVEDASLEIEAARAAAWAAEEIAAADGWRQYYRVGFHRGLRTALSDDALGAHDYHQGIRFGRLDPEARLLGAELGGGAAIDASREAAEAQVAGQFGDLARDPRRDPRPPSPGWTPHGAWAVEPTLDEVFHDRPVRSVRGVARRVDRAFDGWDWDPWRLRGCERHTEFYRDDWRDPRRAFDAWLGDRRRATPYRRLHGEAERERFRSIFRGEYLRRLSAWYDRHLVRGHREGFEDGWRYGAVVLREWHYRLGYTEGFDEAVATAAVAGFHAAFPLAYERHYHAAFDEWSDNPVPGIVWVRIEDASDDDVFQPGEDVLVDFELANYGGADGTFVVVVEGAEIELPAEATVRLPARDSVRSTAPLAATIRAGTPAGTRTHVDVRVADRIESAAMVVSYPLEFTREFDLVADNLAGTARVRVGVANRSSKPIRGRIRLDGVGGRASDLARDVGTLPAAATGWAAFDLRGLRPLDMISGRLGLRFSVDSSGVVHDGLDVRFPDAVSDLGNRDLLDLMVLLARDPAASRADAVEARRLLLRRLEVDWQASVRGNGNPYKRDLKQRGTRTALGDLVRTYEREHRDFRSPEVFRGLDADIEALAEELPGAHPFLRKSMKRLARKLG